MFIREIKGIQYIFYNGKWVRYADINGPMYTWNGIQWVRNITNQSLDIAKFPCYRCLQNPCRCVDKAKFPCPRCLQNPCICPKDSGTGGSNNSSANITSNSSLQTRIKFVLSILVLLVLILLVFYLIPLPVLYYKFTNISYIFSF